MADGKVTYEIVGDNSGFQKTIKETEGVATGGFGKIKAGAAVAWAAVGAAVIAAGKVIFNTVKESIQQYAEYEQLVGGAQLMFGDAYDYVAQKSLEAYKTVGLSQNEYLQQVNGFAIGLRESLGGNEQAAAELADKIVTAEADIVAATGNTQEAVQNAFNGIMKGNYTMLDNLQLGIKPTKEGMQEVIDKVNEWNEAQGKASNYTIDNLADVQNALVDYIEMQGLAGYAAKEAASTIEGSAASAKAAWKNLLTGLSDPNADIQQLVQNFMDAAGTLIDNLLPVIGRALEALFFALVEAGKQIALVVGEWISEAGAAVQEKAVEIWGTIVDWFNEQFTAIAEFFQEIWNGIHEFLIGIWDAIKQVFLDVWNSLSEENQAWLTGIWESIEEIWNNICEFFTSTWETISEIFTTAVEAVSDFLSNAWDAIQSAAESVWNAISSFFSSIWEEIRSVFDSACQACQDRFTAFQDTITQIWDDITQVFNGVITFIRGVFTGDWEAAWQGVSDIFGGIAEGLKDLFSGPLNWIIGKINDTIGRINGITIPDWVPVFGGKHLSIPTIPTLAVGMDYVPSDMFPAFLHKGEAVLTAEQAALWRGLGRENGILSTINNVTNNSGGFSFSIAKIADVVQVREEADIDRISNALFQRFTAEKRGRGLY